MRTTDTIPDHPPERRRRWPRRLLVVATILVVAGVGLAVTDAVMRRGDTPVRGPACVEEAGLFSAQVTEPPALERDDDGTVEFVTVGVEIVNTGEVAVGLHGVDVDLANGGELYGEATQESLDPVTLAVGASHDVATSLAVLGVTAEEWPSEVVEITPQWEPTGNAVRC